LVQGDESETRTRVMEKGMVRTKLEMMETEKGMRVRASV
jgi:hypothetical protein